MVEGLGQRGGGGKGERGARGGEMGGREEGMDGWMGGGGPVAGTSQGEGGNGRQTTGRADWDGRSVARPDRQADGRAGAGQPGARTAGRAPRRAN